MLKKLISLMLTITFLSVCFTTVSSQENILTNNDGLTPQFTTVATQPIVPTEKEISNDNKVQVLSKNMSKIKKDSVGSNFIKIKFKKVDGAQKYIIKYSTNKDLKNAKTKIVKTNKAKLKKLKRNTKYYISVKAYQKINNKKLYTTTSKKTIKTSKWDDPPYGTVRTSFPYGKYSTWGWKACCCVLKYEKFPDGEFRWKSYDYTSMSYEEILEWDKYAQPVLDKYRNKPGKPGQKIKLHIYVWLEK